MPVKSSTSAAPVHCLLSAALCLVGLGLARPGLAAEYEQRQGNGTVRLEADKVEGGRVEIRLSDTIRLTVRIEGKASLEIQLPAALTTSGDWQVKQEAAPQKMALAGGRAAWLARFCLSPLKPGALALVLAPVRFRPSPDTDRWEEIVWRPIPVQVSTEIYRADLSELREIAPPEELPPAPSGGTGLTWAGAALAFLLLLWSGWALLRRRCGGDAARSPSQWALRELEAIPLPRAPTNGVEQFYTRLSDVVRTYLELRYDLPAPKRTTAEFLEALRQSTHLQLEQQAVLRELLERCDLVKFARAPSSLEECCKAAALARTFVAQTALHENASAAGPPAPPPDERSARGTGCS